MQAIYSLMSLMSLILAYLMLSLSVLCSSLSQQCEKKGDSMLLDKINEFVKPFFWTVIFVAAVYDYYYYSSGRGIVNFLMIFFLIIIATLVLGTYYCDNSDSVRNRKLFWLTIYFLSPILCNGASILMMWNGYETFAEYTFKLRYWSLLKTPLLGLLYLMVAKAVKKSQLQLRRARQTTSLVESTDIN